MWSDVYSNSFLEPSFSDEIRHMLYDFYIEKSMNGSVRGYLDAWNQFIDWSLEEDEDDDGLPKVPTVIIKDKLFEEDSETHKVWFPVEKELRDFIVYRYNKSRVGTKERYAMMNVAIKIEEKKSYRPIDKP